MFTLLHRKELAHEDSIWSCGWGRIVHRKEREEELNGEGEGSRDSMETEEIEDIIVTGSMDNTVKVWNFIDDKLEQKHSMEGHCFGVVSLDISSDSSMIVTSSLDSTIRIWNTDDGSLTKKIEAGPLDVWTVAFSPDAKHIISGCHSGKINMYGVNSGTLEQTIDTRGKFILSTAYSPDGKFVASGAVDGIINVYDVATSKLLHTLEGHAMPIRSLTFSPDSELLLTASDDKHMKLYSVRQQKPSVVATLSGHASWVLSVAFSPDNTHFVSSSSDHTVKVWELESRSCVHTFTDHTDQVWQVKYSPDSNKILSVSDDNSINIYAYHPPPESEADKNGLETVPDIMSSLALVGVPLVKLFDQRHHLQATEALVLVKLVGIEYHQSLQWLEDDAFALKTFANGIPTMVSNPRCPNGFICTGRPNPLDYLPVEFMKVIS